MKAAVLFKPNEPLQVVDCELDPPKANEVRVKMKASGVCQSDWHIMNGDWPSPMPIVPGHEAAGEIAECGPGVTTVKPCPAQRSSTSCMNRSVSASDFVLVAVMPP